MLTMWRHTISVDEKGFQSVWQFVRQQSSPCLTFVDPCQTCGLITHRNIHRLSDNFSDKILVLVWQLKIIVWRQTSLDNTVKGLYVSKNLKELFSPRTLYQETWRILSFKNHKLVLKNRKGSSSPRTLKGLKGSSSRTPKGSFMYTYPYCDITCMCEQTAKWPILHERMRRG